MIYLQLLFFEVYEVASIRKGLNVEYFKLFFLFTYFEDLCK